MYESVKIVDRLIRVYGFVYVILIDKDLGYLSNKYSTKNYGSENSDDIRCHGVIFK